MPTKKIEAAKAYIEAMRTGRHELADAASPYLASDVVLNTGARKFSGHDAVLERITGIWPQVPVFIRGDWSAISEEAGNVIVHAKMPIVGAGPLAVNLKFSFNGQDQISAVDQELVPGAQLVETKVIPDFIRRRVNGAPANMTPMAVSYVDENGAPHMSMRGSTVVWSENQLAIWARQANGGLAKAIANNPQIGLIYRDDMERTTIVFAGRAHVDTDPAVRRKLFDMTPEVERLHESWESGAAVIIDLDRLTGGTPDGRVNITW